MGSGHASNTISEHAKCFDYSEELENQLEQQQSLVFLQACKRYGIIPANITDTTIKLENHFKRPNLKRRFEAIEKGFHEQILSLEVAQIKADLKGIEKKLCVIRSELKNYLAEGDYELFTLAQKESVKKRSVKVKQKQQKELNKLKEQYFIEMGFYFDPNGFENNTEIEIPWECKWLLALGRDFALPIDKRKLHTLDIIAAIEVFIQDSNAENKKKIIARKKLANRISEYKLNNKKQTAQEKFILAVFKDTKDFLRRQKNIIITRTYNEGKTIAIYKQEYEKKIKELLDDRNYYRISRRHPTHELIKKNNTIITNLYKKEIIDIDLKNSLFCSAALAPRIEVLPLIHKDTVIMKPILAFSTQAPGYQLSKYIKPLLENIVCKQYNVKSSLELKKLLESITIEENECLAAFKVKSLFNNISLKNVADAISNKWNIIKKFTHLTRTQFLEITDFCLYDNRYFVFGNEVFCQTNGMPVGHLLTPIIADIFMDNLITKVLAELSKQSIPIKYVAKSEDHILAVIKIADRQEIFDSLNGYHSKINFTAKFDTNEKIIYLDTRLYREGNIIRCDWYTKSISSAGVVNFNATLAKTYIINTAKVFIQKVLAISDEKFYDQTLKKIHEILTMQSFPHGLIEFLLKSDKTTRRHLYSCPTNEADIKYWIKYIPGLTDPKTLKTIKDEQSTEFGYVAHTTLNEIFTNLKTPVEMLQQINVVYEIPCKGTGKNDCHLVYIGMTKRSLEIRVNEHKTSIRKNSNSTALAQHMKQNNHVADFENTKILDVENNEKKLGIKESLRIQQKLNRTMNIRTDTDKSGAFYRSIL